LVGKKARGVLPITVWPSWMMEILPALPARGRMQGGFLNLRPISEGLRFPSRIRGIGISRFASRFQKVFFSTYIHSVAPFFGIALHRDGK